MLTPLRVQVYSYLDQFPGSVIGRVHASDQDPHDLLGFELLPGQGGGAAVHNFYRLFEIDRRNGDLVALQGLDVGQYSVNVSVSDGKYVSFQGVEVDVKLVTDKVLKDAVIIKFSQVSPEKFVASYKKNFVNIVKNMFNVGPEHVEVLGSNQPSPEVVLSGVSGRLSHTLDSQTLSYSWPSKETRPTTSPGSRSGRPSSGSSSPSPLRLG